jgi:hypothetical protein
MAARERALRHLAGNTAPTGSNVIPGSEVPVLTREQYGQKLVMYGSTQTHSLGAKVDCACALFQSFLTSVLGCVTARLTIPSRTCGGG